MDPRVSQVVEWIDKNLEKDITLRKASRLANLSYGYLSELFNKETGMGFSEYLKDRRIERARVLLANTRMEIKEIYLSVGYRNIQNFYRDFKKRTGLAPKKYRQKAES